MFRIIFLGDIVGKPGRILLREQLPLLRKEFEPDLIIANGENAAGGLGIDISTSNEIFAAGVQVITTGNHIWDKKEINSVLQSNNKLIRPLNFPHGAPGQGYTVHVSERGIPVAIINTIGRVFMPQLVDCPFRAVDVLLEEKLKDVKIRFVDFHAEANSEKVAYGYHLDGRVAVVVGTHTHVQTADLRILPGGTAHITDAGMCGPLDGVIGIRADYVVAKFISGLPTKFDVPTGATQLCGIFAEIDESSGKTVRCERIYRTFEAMAA